MTDLQKVVVAGAAPNSGNLGVNALCSGLTAALYPRLTTPSMTLLDFSRSVRQGIYECGQACAVTFAGANHSRRYYHSSCLTNVYVQSRLGVALTGTAKLFRDSVILDVSGGDSFTDLYGIGRFNLVSFPKMIAKSYRTPLVLMPQTIGPFADPAVKARAVEYIKYARLVYTRDARSFQYLKELLGDDFDPARCKEGVDMAFLLQYEDASAEWIAAAKAHNTIGLNVSGLIYNDPDEAKSRYGIEGDYRAAMKALVDQLLDAHSGHLALVPHVLVRDTEVESDYAACKHLYESLTPAQQARVEILPTDLNERQIKGYIRHFEWFCGMRMHATIAAISSGVPTANIAYSGKSLGVFETVDVGDQVVDARSTGTEGLVARALQSYHQREDVRQRLADALPRVRARADSQMNEVAQLIAAHAAGQAG